MADFDADELGKRLDKLNRERLTKLEELSERLLRELEAHKSLPKRADEARRPDPDNTAGRRRTARSAK